MNKIFITIALAATLSASAVFAQSAVDTSRGQQGIDHRGEWQRNTPFGEPSAKVDGIAWFDRMRDGVEQFKEAIRNDVWMVGPSRMMPPRSTDC